MNLLVRFFKKMELLLRRKRFSRELEEEMAFHREQVENELRSDGMEPDAAQHAARRQFGNQTRLNEQSHEIVGFGFENVAQDLRFAVRQLCGRDGCVRRPPKYIRFQPNLQHQVIYVRTFA